MNQSQKAIQNYFTKRVKCYEEIYSKNRHGGLRNIINRLYWLPMRVTFKHTMQYLAAIKAQNVLDIGCGCGIYSVNLARQGVAVTAIDVCKAMIDATEAAIEKFVLYKQIKTVLVDFIPWSMEVQQRYDLALAIGILDYVPNAGEWLTSFRRVAREVIMTFPAKSPFSIAAHIKYRFHGIRGYAYTQREIEHLLHSAGMEIVCLSRLLPGLYWIHAISVSDNANQSTDTHDG